MRLVIPEKDTYRLGREVVSGNPSERRLVTGGTDPLLPHLLLHLDGSTNCDIAVAFLLERFSVDVNRNNKGVPRSAQIRFELL
jgi:hypothetical protein